MFYPVRIPKWLQACFPNYYWRMPSSAKPTIYLTFDDGPIPVITPWVLEQLAAYEAKATFFCVGANVERHPSVYQQVLKEGHGVGNHTFRHQNGWKTSKTAYLKEVADCAHVVDSKLFRPPYGRLTWAQSKALQKHYKLIMWEFLAGDFDPKLTGEQCWQRLKGQLEDGSIIVLHDSKKAWERLQIVLPKLLDYYHQQGFTFAALPLE